VAAAGFLALRPGDSPAPDVAAELAARSAAERVTRDLDRTVTPTPTPTPSVPATPSVAPPPPSSSPQSAKPRPRVTTAKPKTTTTTTVPVSCQSYDGNQRIACTLLPRYGYSTSQMSPLVKLWTKESGWNHEAENKSSGAYGIPQALPGDKMASEGSDWRTNPATQIKWGLSYIKDRYGSPTGAWSHFQSHNWY
jgi:hypothetical protein